MNKNHVFTPEKDKFDHPLLVGVKWFYSESPNEDLKRIKNEYRERGEKVRVVIIPIDQNEKNGLVGVIESDEGKSKKAWIAAPIFAKAIETGIVVLRMDNDLYWVAVFNDGVVVPGGDQVVPSSDLSNVVNQWYIDSGINKIFGDHQESIQDSDWVFSRVREAIEEKEIPRKIFAACTGRNVVDTRIIFYSAVGIFLVAGYYFLGDWLLGKEKVVEVYSEQVDIERIKSEQERQRVMKIQEELLSQFKKDVFKRKEELFAHPAEDYFASMIDAIEEFNKRKKYNKADLSCNVIPSSNGNAFQCLMKLKIPAKFGPLVQVYNGANSIQEGMMVSDVVDSEPFIVPIRKWGNTPWKKRTFDEKWQWPYFYEKVFQFGLQNNFMVFGTTNPILVSNENYKKDGVSLPLEQVEIGKKTGFQINEMLLTKDNLEVLGNLFYNTEGIQISLSSFGITENKIMIKGDVMWGK